MLKYRQISFFFIFILVVVAASDVFFRIPVLLYAGTILAYIALLAWGSADVSSGFYIKTLCRGKMDQKTLALTFDDGPDSRTTPALLEVLEKEDVKAAFFIIGRKAEENCSLLRRIDSEGHLIGAHSYSHSNLFDLFSRKRMLGEMNRTEEIISDCIGRKIRMFRPPFGVTNPALSDAIKQKGYHVIGWSLRSRDTVISDEEKLLARLKAHIKPGDVILLHDSPDHTASVTAKFIKYAKEQGYTFERPDILLGIEAYETN